MDFWVAWDNPLGIGPIELLGMITPASMLYSMVSSEIIDYFIQDELDQRRQDRKDQDRYRFILEQFASGEELDPRWVEQATDWVEDYTRDIKDLQRPNLYEDVNDGQSGVVESIDPNELIGPAGWGEANYMAGEGTYAYRLNFENDKKATLPPK